MSGLERARRMLVRDGGWIESARTATDAQTYHVRLGPTRKSRVNLTLDETAFRSLVASPGLTARPGGGWQARLAPGDGIPEMPVGRPGVVDGVRFVMTGTGDVLALRANVGETPIAWLARRRDQSGRPWLSPAEVAAGERLRLDAERASTGPSLTMRWDALPRSGCGSAARVEPGDHALSAASRVEAALVAVGPRLRGFLVQICIVGSSLQLAERDFGLRKRQGKTVLKQALQALAEHYGIG